MINIFQILVRLLIMLFVLSPLVLVAQKKTQFRGRVLDSETQKPIKDVNIIIIGTPIGGKTDSLGEFSLELTKDNQLNFSHVSYERLSSYPFKSTDFFLKKRLYFFGEIDFSNFQPLRYPTPKFKTIEEEEMPEELADGLYVIVEEPVTFPATTEELLKYIGFSFKYPREAIINHYEESVHVFFVVNKLGEIEIIKFGPEVKYGIKEEIERILKKVKCIPAKQRGEPMETEFILTLHFRFNEFWEKQRELLGQ